MFDIGFQELVIIFVIALLVLGPEKLPEVSKKLGKWVIEIRRGIDAAKMQMESEIKAIEPRVEGDVNNLFGHTNREAVCPDIGTPETAPSKDNIAGTKDRA